MMHQNSSKGGKNLLGSKTEKIETTKGTFNCYTFRRSLINHYKIELAIKMENTVTLV